MLVLSRKYRESVVVGGLNDVEQLLKVTVLEIRGGSVSLGFEGDRDVPIHRSEVWEQIRADRQTEAQVCNAGSIRQGSKENADG